MAHYGSDSAEFTKLNDESVMASLYWTLAAGFLGAVIIIVGIHKLSAVRAGRRSSRRTKDRIWTLEKAFFGLAVSIIILAHSRELYSTLTGEHPPETMERDFAIAIVGLVVSAIILLIARLADAILGEE